MLEVRKEGVVLGKTDHGFENEGVLNPAVIKVGNEIHMFYRAVSRGNYSSIGYCTFSDPLVLTHRDEVPILFPQFESESHGMEDPRIVQIDGLFYMTYTAYDGVNALGALVISQDLKTFERKGLIVPQLSFSEFSRLAGSKATLNEKYLRYNDHRPLIEKHGKPLFVSDKNVIFFPRKIHGKFYFLHRIKPDIQMVCVENLDELTVEFWQNYLLHLDQRIVMCPKYEHEVSYIGGGCPPIETADGWLLIYHGVHDTVSGYVYSACAALLDLNDPYKVIARLPNALFMPEYNWELVGEVNNVCFPTGSIVVDDRLFIYYGAADEQIACASMSLSGLVGELLLNTTKK